MKRVMEIYHHHRAEIHRMGRFGVIGAWNTVFGVGVYALFFYLWGDRVHYLLLLIPSSILAITNAYICHKLFVFKTSGNILREYFRFYVVYGGTALLGFGLMFILVDGFGFSPVVAQFLCVPIAIGLSYVSHRNYSFRKPKDKTDNDVELRQKFTGNCEKP